MTRIENKVTQDTALKNFWRDNQHFADLFNAVLFIGKEVLKAEDLKEVDTDVSSIVKFNKHIETVKRILDVVRKTAYGVDFIIWGLENQGKIHYAMPLRHMIGDSLIYLKEYQGIAARNRKEKGSELNMCKALEKLMNESMEKGKVEGEQEGKIQGVILTCHKFKISREETLKNLIEEFAFSKEEASSYMKKYW
ncbi:hypothetical protein [Methanosphaera sp.]|uniref:hypothetical protein n=1 Tax=Methanosphaera sp. TaxID=2666342 RepID=UPI0026DFF1CA|nr:hypothetical protein [Methanosphaera sp.]MDO5822828.1 hypothetical protein [Methanosphaera sp.]